MSSKAISGGSASGDPTITAIKHQNHDDLARPYCDAAKALGLHVSSNNPSTLGFVGSKFSTAVYAPTETYS